MTSARHASDVIGRLDPLNFVAVKVEPFYNGNKLSDATGFFYHGFLDGKPNYWLITNWHVVTGRNVDTLATLATNGCVPNRLRVSLLLKTDQPEYNNHADARLLFANLFIELYDGSGRAAWTQHQCKYAFDVAVINGKSLETRHHLVGINQIAKTNDMAIQLGNDVFILGYPLGFTHFLQTPIWKRGSIASEPNLETTETRNRVVIDATTRMGMSGAPVIMREKTHYVAENGEVRLQVNATRFLGIYASRPDIALPHNLSDEDRRPEVGYFYKGGCIHETIAEGILGPNYGELP